MIPHPHIDISIDLRRPPDPQDIVARLASPAPPAASLLMLTLTSSDPHDRAGTPRAMPAAAACVGLIAVEAKAAGLRVTLCPRLDTWLARAEHAVRLAMRVNREHVGVAFDLDAWQLLDADMSQLGDRLRLVLPKLHAVTGSTVIAQTEAWHIVLDRLQSLGWHGPLVVR